MFGLKFKHCRSPWSLSMFIMKKQHLLDQRKAAIFALVLETKSVIVMRCCRYSEEDDVLNIMENNLIQRHVCPTAPDTLPCHPFTDKEPFIIDECPHLYFTGNQDSFATREVRTEGNQQTRLVSVPCFSRCGIVVLFNLRTFECHPMFFDTAL